MSTARATRLAYIDPQIIALATSGLTGTAIADHLSISASDANRRIKFLRAEGKIPPLWVCRGQEGPTEKAPGKAASDKFHIRSRSLMGKPVRIGCMGDVFAALGPRQIDWIARNTPDGATAADLIAAMVTDAIEEEMGSE